MTTQNTFVLQTQREPLYKITSDFLELLEMQTAVNEDGVAENEELDFLKDTIEGKKFEFEEKVLNTGKFIKNIEAEVDEIKGIETAFKKRLEKIQTEISKRNNKIKRLKDYLHSNMNTVGILKIDSVDVTVTVAKNGGKLPMIWTVDDMVERERIVPDDYKRKVIDDSKVRQALDEGQELEFAKLGERETHLRIK